MPSLPPSVQAENAALEAENAALREQLMNSKLKEENRLLRSEVESVQRTRASAAATAVLESRWAATAAAATAAAATAAAAAASADAASADAQKAQNPVIAAIHRLWLSKSLPPPKTADDYAAACIADPQQSLQGVPKRLHGGGYVTSGPPSAEIDRELVLASMSPQVRNELLDRWRI